MVRGQVKGVLIWDFWGSRYHSACSHTNMAVDVSGLLLYPQDPDLELIIRPQPFSQQY